MKTIKVLLLTTMLAGIVGLALGQTQIRAESSRTSAQTTVVTRGTIKPVGEPKVAVANLAFEERVRDYFRVVSASSKSSLNASSSERESANSYSARDRVNARSESSYHSAEGTYTYIDRRELRGFTADIKGNMLKGGGVRLVEARPYTEKDSEKLYDVIARIKQGMFPGADYVLFGSVSNVEFRNQFVPVQGTSTTNHIFSLDLVVDFSLIDTKTYQVLAAFSAMGEAQDVKMNTGRGDVVSPNRSRVIMETSKSLGEQAYGQLVEQFGMANPDLGSRRQPTQAGRAGNNAPPPSRDGPVIDFRN